MNLPSQGWIIFQLLELGQNKKNFVYKYFVAHKHSKPNSRCYPGVLLSKALPLAWFVCTCTVWRTPALQCDPGESLSLLITHSISSGNRIQTSLGLMKTFRDVQKASPGSTACQRNFAYQTCHGLETRGKNRRPVLYSTRGTSPRLNGKDFFFLRKK